MFLYPDSEPVGHCITDVSPSYLTDGVFFNGYIGPSHKCVDKQLSAIPRGLNDPVAPRAQVNPRTLENWTVQSKAYYVDNCGRNAKALYAMMKLLPKEKVDPYAGWKSKSALFPSSEQYEYWYIKNMRTNDSKNQVEKIPPKCTEVEINPRFVVYSVPRPTSAFEYTKTPISWQDKIPTRIECAVGFPDDYAFQRFHEPAALEKTLTSKKPSFQNPLAHVPGVIYSKQNQQENELQEISETVDSVKVAIKSKGEHPKDFHGDCDCEQYSPHKSLICKIERNQDLKKAEVDPGMKLDPRWHSLHEVCDVPDNDVDRKSVMLNLYKPYHHEINTW